MTKAVLSIRREPSYDDLPDSRYHFPRTYLNHVRQAIGDAILYYEPRRQDNDPAGRDGRQSYIATARIVDVAPDPKLRDHFYAHITDYLDFEQPVGFRERDHYYESALRKDDGSANRGAFGRAVRLIPDDEYQLICAAGFAESLNVETSTDQSGFREEQAPYDRPIVEQLVRRPFREAAFARNIRTAYNATCALTGIKLINGGGRAEIEAAHIRPVGDDHRGSDSIRNGLALCRTVHWMFDRGLVSLDDDFSILVSDSRVPTEIQRLFVPERVALVPNQAELQPHRSYLEYHRNEIFKP